MKITITDNDYKVQIYNTPNGYLCTIDVLEDGEVSFGSTGEFCKTPSEAMHDTMLYLSCDWPKEAIPSKLLNAYEMLK